MNVREDEGLRPEQLRDVRGFSSRRGAGIEHPHPGLEAEERRDQLRGLALEGEAALVPGAERAQPRGAVLDQKPARRPRARRRGEAVGRELRLERVPRRDGPIGTQRRRRPLVVGREQRGQCLRAEFVGPAGDQPARMRPLDGEASERIAGGGRERPAPQRAVGPH